MVGQELFPHAPPGTRSTLNQLVGRIPMALCPAFGQLRRGLYILGTPAIAETLTTERKNELTSDVEKITKDIEGVLGKSNTEFLMRGLGSDVDPDVVSV